MNITVKKCRFAFVGGCKIIAYFLFVYQGAVALTDRSHVGLSQNYVIFFGCWKWTINQIDIIQKRSYVGPILLLVQRPPDLYSILLMFLATPLLSYMATLMDTLKLNLLWTEISWLSGKKRGMGNYIIIWLWFYYYQRSENTKNATFYTRTNNSSDNNDKSDPLMFSFYVCVECQIMKISDSVTELLIL